MASEPGTLPQALHRPRGAASSILIVAVIFASRIPFLLIHQMQEDAFITFRTARHLAEYGDFSFNFHEHLPGTTSLLYPVIVAGLDLIFRGWMIVAVQVLGILCVALAAYLAARALSDDSCQWRLIWLLSSCWPVSMLASYTGMEIPLLLLALGAAVFALARPGSTTLFAASL